MGIVVYCKDMEKEVGRVSHYYDKIGVVIIDLSAPLAVGDTIKIKRGDDEFQHTIASMEVEYKSVMSGTQGQSVGVKIDRKAKEGAIVHKM